MSYAFFIFLYHNLPLLSCITFPFQILLLQSLFFLLIFLLAHFQSFLILSLSFINIQLFLLKVRIFFGNFLVFYRGLMVRRRKKIIEIEGGKGIILFQLLFSFLVYVLPIFFKTFGSTFLFISR